jgi:enolase
MRIKDIVVREVLDSRGEKTIEVAIADEDLRAFYAQIPSGRSRGKSEAVVLGTAAAEDAAAKIERAVQGVDFKTVEELDRKLIAMDGTPNKEKLGGNVMLGISLAFARALAFERKAELWQVLNGEFFGGKKFSGYPLIFSNLINGGKHAKNDLPIQEYMAVVRPRGSYVKTVGKLMKFYEVLGEALRCKTGEEELPLGDEGGYAVDFEDAFEPIQLMADLIAEHNLEDQFRLGLDAAASSFYENGVYDFGGLKLDAATLRKTYEDWFAWTPGLMSIEDPFDEKKGADFADLRQALGGFAEEKWVVGDDLTVTNATLIKKYAGEGAINAVIIKANQIGTLTETCAAMSAAASLGLKRIVSHRSGETEDNFLIHLAKAAGAEGVKIGAPHESRIGKYNELLRLMPDEMV